MVEFSNLEAYIILDHIPLPEYAITTDERSASVTCWIPCRASKTFAVSWRNTVPFAEAVGGYVKVDGINCKGEKPINRGLCQERVHSEVFTSPTFTKPFKFSYLEPVATHSCKSTNCMKDLGDIVLDIWTVNPVEAHSPFHFELPPPKVCERGRKDITHCVTLGEERYVGVQSILKCMPLKRLATFIFKYRSPEILEDMGIIPRLQLASSNARSTPLPRNTIAFDHRDSISINKIVDNSGTRSEVLENRRKREYHSELSTEDVPPEKKAKTDSEVPLRSSLGFVLGRDT